MVELRLNYENTSSTQLTLIGVQNLTFTHTKKE